MTTSGFALKCNGAEDCTRKLRALADLSGIIAENCAGPIQQTMRNSAVANLDRNDAVDTGALRASVEVENPTNSFVERGDGKVSIGIRTDVSYALYIEYGTGPLGDPAVPHTEKMTWAYPTGRLDASGKPEFRTAHSQPARPFMRPALYDNGPAFETHIRDGIKGAFE